MGIQQVIKQDVPPIGIGCGFIGFASWADATDFIQALGIWGGTALVFVTLGHRLYTWYKEARKQ